MSQKTLSPDELRDWICLARTPNVGPVTFEQLLARYTTPAKALAALPELEKKAGRKKPLVAPPDHEVQGEIDATHAYGARIIASCEPDYPPLLRAIGAPPPVITLLGRAELAAQPTVAIVGARNASAAGRKMARDMAAQLGQAGYAIVSGLALGIDGEAHAASLQTGTIAVLGGGIDHIYPRQHDRLYAEVAEKGLIIAEPHFSYRAGARDFPRRNRIVTGLSRGVVVVEAAERSGSLISARVAGEQGREVMAVPGSPLDPRAHGTNNLIRQGAALVRNADDVLEVLETLSPLGLEAGRPNDWLYEAVEPDIPQSQIDKVREALSPHPMPIDELARSAGIGSHRCAAILMELELLGHALTFAGGLASQNI